MEWACVWSLTEDKWAAKCFVLPSTGRCFSSPARCCQLRVPSTSSVTRRPGIAKMAKQLAQAYSRNEKTKESCSTLTAAEHPCPSFLMNMLLLTWVFPRARAPFELCLLDSSQLLLLWLSEIQLPLCPGSERSYVSIHYLVIIIKSQQELACGEIMEPAEGKWNWLEKIRESICSYRKSTKENLGTKSLTYTQRP